MNARPLRIGFVRLVDAAPIIVAHEMGFAREEGLELSLEAAPNWSTLRDRLSFGQLDAAHMLAPVPVAGALGLGGGGAWLQALSVLSVNGNVIGVSREVARRMAQAGHGFDFSDAYAAGRALIAAKGADLRIGVPFPFSMHAELVYYWLSVLGLPAPQSIQIRTVPPALMKEAMEAGELDAFCVGEPWGSRSVEAGVASLLLPSSAIWSFAPEKVLAVRADWTDTHRDTAERLIRAVWRAGRWLAEPSSKMLTAELLSKKRYLDLPAELLDRALTGQFVISPDGESRDTAGFVEFFAGGRGLSLAQSGGVDRAQAGAAHRPRPGHGGRGRARHLPQ